MRHGFICIRSISANFNFFARAFFFFFFFFFPCFFIYFFCTRRQFSRNQFVFFFYYYLPCLTRRRYNVHAHTRRVLQARRGNDSNSCEKRIVNLIYIYIAAGIYKKVISLDIASALLCRRNSFIRTGIASSRFLSNDIIFKLILPAELKRKIILRKIQRILYHLNLSGARIARVRLLVYDKKKRESECKSLERERERVSMQNARHSSFPSYMWV